MKINIIHMGFFYSGGGERVAIEQTRLLRMRGHQVKLFSPIIYLQKSYPELAELNPQRIVPHLPLPFPFRESLAMIASAVFPFRDQEMGDCDVMLCHSQPSMWIGRRLNRRCGTPYVGYLHQLTSFIHTRPKLAGNWNATDFRLLDGLLGSVVTRRVAEHLDILSHRGASTLLFNSWHTQKLYRETYGLEGSVCHPGIPPPRSTDVFRRDMVMTAARHYPWKRLDLALLILYELFRSNMRPDLYVTGEFTGITRSLIDTARKLGVMSKVTFTGHVADSYLSTLYSEAKAYIQTSIYEPFGMSVVEAQSYGTPAVVWGDAGANETVKDGETGFHAEPYDTRDFASKVNQLLADQGLWDRMSRSARIWASSFTWDRHADILEDALREAL